MASILIIAYYFPPWGMGGVQRVLKFAKYLPEFGHDVTVIAPDAGPYHEQDQSLLAEIPGTVRVERVRYHDQARSFAIRTGGLASSIPTGIRSMFDWPDRHRDFARMAVERARTMKTENTFDIVITSSPPPSVHLAGKTLHDQMAWVADFRDPWQAFIGDYGPTILHRRHNSRLHQRILTDADAVTAVTPELAEHFRRLVPSARITAIRNGYDEADFLREGEATAEPAIDAQASKRNADEFFVVIPGTLSRFSDPRPIFAALRVWQRQARTRRLRVRHVGATIGIDLRRILEDTGLRDAFEDTGYVDHTQAIKEIVDADMIAIAYTDPDVTDVSVPGRVYEALCSLRPLLVFTPPDGALANLLRPLDGCVVVPPNDVAAVVAAINRFASLTAMPTVRTRDSIQSFERREQTRQLSDLCMTAIAAHREAAR